MTRSIRRGLKRGLDACCTAALLPAALMCAIEAAAGDGHDAAFVFWAQALAVVPGVPGVFLRRAFYRWTLERCAPTFFVGFGAIVSHRQVTIEEDVYIGPYAIIGSASLHRGSLVGSRCSIPSGGALHTLGADLHWTATDMSRVRRVDIGEFAWLGEASVILADVGASAMVAAGSVVSSTVPSLTMVGGNPARFVRRLTPPADAEEVPRVAAAVSVR
jgi:virginiamycin A acetyltransferase